MTVFSNKSLFDIKEHTGWKFHDYSDFMTVTEELYSTGWENISKNSNFKINSDNIDFLINNYVEITYVSGNLAEPNGGGYYTENFSLIEILRDTEIDDSLKLEVLNIK